MPAVTLTCDGPTGVRILAKLGETLSLVDGAGAARAATLQEYKDWCIDLTKRMVQGRELMAAHAVVERSAPTDVVLI